MPRYRQKLAVPPLETGRPLWVDDPNFNLAYHVRHTALPEPGDEDALLALAARVFSQRLDRSKPLWELWLVEGRAGGGFALLSKTHHALVDGVSGVDLASVLFDLSPEGRRRRRRRAVGAAARAVERGARRARADAARCGRWPRSPPARSARLRARRGARQRARGRHGHRRGRVDRAQRAARHAVQRRARARTAGSRSCAPSLDEFKLVKDAFGTTVNDVVLAVVTGALAYFLQSRGRRTEGIELKAAVPVSVRSEDQRGALGNQLTQIMAPLPVFLDDPLARLRYVKDAMDGLKESRQALAASAIASLQGFAPPTIHAQASRLNFAGRFFNLLVTNVPGPQFPLYVLGRRMSEIFPIPFLAGERALAIAIISYDGKVGFGLLGDYDALPDLDVVAEGIEASLAQLVTLAKTA